MKWLSANVDLAAVVLLVVLFAVSPSRRAVELETNFANLDSLNNVIAMRVDQVGELLNLSVNRIVNCSAGWGD
jgi:hypothetical protein